MMGPTSQERRKPGHRRLVDLDNSGSIRGSRRLSARLRGQVAGTEVMGEDDQPEDSSEQQPKYKYVMPDRPNWYGQVPGVDIGTVWMMRVDCCRDGVHRPTVAGIHMGPDGAYSIALSGGYEDDVDLGDCFTYTGEGGRDLKGTSNKPKNLRTAAQSKNQELTRGNLALSRSVETGNTVRVIRGYKLRSPFAPDEGYRYDGLYTVEKFWFTKGLSGFGVYKFALRRCKSQAAPPWELVGEAAASPSKSSDSGFSDAANGDVTTSEDGQKKSGSGCGDSDVSPDSPSTVDEDKNSDAKSDAGESDAKSDAGESDAKSDAGESDAKSDAGESDAKSDAGESDAKSDAGESDAKSATGESDKSSIASDSQNEGTDCAKERGEVLNGGDGDGCGNDENGNVALKASGAAAPEEEDKEPVSV